MARQPPQTPSEVPVHSCFVLQFCNSSAWENRPEVFKPASARTELLSALFDTSTFRKVVKKLEKHGRQAITTATLRTRC